MCRHLCNQELSSIIVNMALGEVYSNGSDLNGMVFAVVTLCNLIHKYLLDSVFMKCFFYKCGFMFLFPLQKSVVTKFHYCPRDLILYALGGE
jgi:hypothetical protein